MQKYEYPRALILGNLSACSTAPHAIYISHLTDTLLLV